MCRGCGSHLPLLPNGQVVNLEGKGLGFKNKGIRDAGNTADYRILFEIFEILEILDFF